MNNQHVDAINISKASQIIITSALPYANGEIHLGHISSTYLPADIFRRFLQLSGKNVVHICASDDYGTPILIKSEQEKKSPSDFVKYWNERDFQDLSSLNIIFDKFYMTSSKENKELVQYVYNKLYTNGHIYKKNVIQFFCEFDKKFLPDRYVVGTCPNCNATNQYSDLCEKCGKVPDNIIDPKCWICKREPIKKESLHYFFKLSNFSEKIKEWLISNQNLKSDIKKYVLNWIDDGLQDWDITRDLSWGIPIPIRDSTEENNQKVFYGWFDNHLCYISTFEKLMHENNVADGKKAWNRSLIYHFIGKDIVYHHYLFLPAIRIGIDLEYKLPDYIPVRGHLMLHNEKISKSRNWYIGIKDFISNFDQDYLRFYITSISTFNQDDFNFDWDSFNEKINSGLIDNIGNFINRTLSFTAKTFNSIVPIPDESLYDDYDKEAIKKIKNIHLVVGKHLESLEMDKGLGEILRFSNYFNEYFQKKQPWKNTEESKKSTIFISINAVRSLAILLEPFVPSSSEKIWTQLNLEGNIHQQKWHSIPELNIKGNHTIQKKITPLFKKIEKQEIEKQKEKLGKKKPVNK